MTHVEINLLEEEHFLTKFFFSCLLENVAHRFFAKWGEGEREAGDPHNNVYLFIYFFFLFWALPAYRDGFRSRNTSCWTGLSAGISRGSVARTGSGSHWILLVFLKEVGRSRILDHVHRCDSLKVPYYARFSNGIQRSRCG